MNFFCQSESLISRVSSLFFQVGKQELKSHPYLRQWTYIDLYILVDSTAELTPRKSDQEDPVRQ